MNAREETTHQSELSQRIFEIARAGAMRSLKARADRLGLLITICGKCKTYLGEKPGDGQSGFSHSLCERCFAEAAAEVIA